MPNRETFRFRIYCSETDVVELPDGAEIETRYPAYMVVHGTEEALGDLRARYPVEELSTASPPPSFPEVAGLAAAMGGGRERGPYIVAVRFAPPIPADHEVRLNSAGCRLLATIGNSTVAVRCPNKASRARVQRLEGVEKVTPFVPSILISPEFLQNVAVKADGAEVAGAADRLAASDVSRRSLRRATLGGLLNASFLTADDRRRARNKLRREGLRPVVEVGSTGLVINLAGTDNVVEDLHLVASLRGLKKLTEKKVRRLFNDVAREVICGPTVLPAPGGLGLTGAGEIVAVADSGLDTGDLLTVHADFRGRVRDISSFPIAGSLAPFLLDPDSDDGAADRFSGHGTHVCGSVLGNGSRSRALGLDPIEGVAPEAELVFQAIDQSTEWNMDGTLAFLQQGGTPPAHGLFGIPDDLGDLFQPAFDLGARIHSNSWGGGGPGEYDEQCEALDQFVLDHPGFLVVVAAGNDGADTTPGGGQGIDLGSVSSPATAKNCLTVGACENFRPGDSGSRTYGDMFQDFPNGPFASDPVADSVDDVVAFSSRGPCTTGRRKPDVIAPGTFILSTRSSQIASNNFAWGAFAAAKLDYMFMGGTSMATPLVAGCCALVRQFLRENTVAEPSAALLKAALIHSARYTPYRFAHPSSQAEADNEQGWGRLRLQTLLMPEAPIQVLFVNGDSLHSGQQQEFRIKVADGSVPLRLTLVYSDFPGEDLINNLNLIAIPPDGGFHLGNDFGGGMFDGDNNVEGIRVEEPDLGVWTVRVVASDVPRGPQDFALVISAGGAERLHTDG